MSISLYVKSGIYFVVADVEPVSNSDVLESACRLVRISASEPKFVAKITILLLDDHFDMKGNEFMSESSAWAISKFSQCVKKASQISIVSTTPQFVKSASDLLSCTGVTHWTCPTDEIPGFAMIGSKMIEFASFETLFAELCPLTDRKIIIGESTFATDMSTLLESWKFESNSAKHVLRHAMRADSKLKSKYDINSQEEINLVFRIGRISNVFGKIHVKCAGAKTSIYDSAEECFNYIEESTPQTINPVVRQAFIQRFS